MHNRSVKRFRELLIVTITIFLLQPTLQLHSNEIIKLKVATSSNDQVNLIVGNSQIIELDKKISTAQVTDKNLVDILALSPNRIQLIARKPGLTTLNLWDENKQRQALKISVNVDTKQVEKLLRTLIPESQINIRTIPGGIALTGNVTRTEEIDLCHQLVQHYYGTQDLTIVNGINVSQAQPIRLNISIIAVSRDSNRSSEGSIQSRLIPSGEAFSFSTTDHSFTFGILNQKDALLNDLDRLSKNGTLTILSKPSLLSESGHSANLTLNEAITTPELTQQSPSIIIPLNLSLNLTATRQSQASILLQAQPIITGILQSNSSGTDSAQEYSAKHTATTAISLQSGQTLAIAATLLGQGMPTQTGLPITNHTQINQSSQATGIGTFNNHELELLLLITPQTAPTEDRSQSKEKKSRPKADVSKPEREKRQLSRKRKTAPLFDNTIGRSQLLNGRIVPELEKNSSRKDLPSSTSLDTPHSHSTIITNTSTRNSQ